MNTVCRRYKDCIIRKFHDHYVIVTPKGELYLVDTEEDAEREIDEMNINNLAERIIDLDFYGFKDADGNVESVAQSIKEDPVLVISWLLDYISSENT